MEAGAIQKDLSEEHENSYCKPECANYSIDANCLAFKALRLSEQSIREIDKLLVICAAEKPDKHVIRVDLPGKKSV
jgi:hypothetical protein